MNIERLKTKEGIKWEFVKVSTKEALSIIKSLTNQMLKENPNSGRLETRIDNGYFTIIVET